MRKNSYIHGNGIRYTSIATYAAIILLLFHSCSAGKDRNAEGHEKSIYYWKTVFKLSDWDTSFIARHGIKKIYLRLFDVDYDYDYDGRQQSIPMATTRFDSNIPKDVEIVPVVYITPRAIRQDPRFANKLYERIVAMAAKNGFSNFRELQLDCDWADATRQNFFYLCDTMLHLLHSDGKKLSATIRLHQLKREIPPVDYGVLMIYNTGSLYNSSTENSILSFADVKPYLRSKIEYPIHLSYAYPVYSWGILLDKNNTAKYILHKSNFNDSALYEHIGGNKYKVVENHTVEGHNLHTGDIIRREAATFSEVDTVKYLVTKKVKSRPRGTIIYHLDSLELSRFTDNEIDDILK